MVNDILSPRIKNEKSVYPTFYKRLSGLRSSDFMPLQEESDFEDLFYSAFLPEIGVIAKKKIIKEPKLARIGFLDNLHKSPLQSSFNLESECQNQLQNQNNLNYFFLESYIPKNHSQSRKPGRFSLRGFSNLLLGLKDNCPVAIETFLQFFLPINLEKFVIVAVPSSTPDSKSGIRCFAQALAKQNNTRVLSGLLKRTRLIKKKSLVGHSRSLSEEIDTLSLEKPQKLHQKNILLLDDICTSGTTLKACELTLLRANPKKIVNFVLGHTRTRSMAETYIKKSRTNQRFLLRCPQCDLWMNIYRVEDLEEVTPNDYVYKCLDLDVKTINNYFCSSCSIGFFADFHSCGGVKEIGCFVNNERHGKWSQFDESGLVLSKKNYDYGLQHGRQFTRGSYDMYEHGNWIGAVGKKE